MAFYKEAVVIQGYLEEIGQLIIPVGDNGCGKGDQIGFNFHGSIDDGIRGLYQEAALF